MKTLNRFALVILVLLAALALAAPASSSTAPRAEQDQQQAQDQKQQQKQGQGQQQGQSASNRAKSEGSYADANVDFDAAAASAAGNAQAYCTRGRGSQTVWFGTSSNETDPICLADAKANDRFGLASRLRTKADYLAASLKMKKGTSVPTEESKDVLREMDRLRAEAVVMEAEAKKFRKASDDALMVRLANEPTAPTRVERGIMRFWDGVLNVIYPVKLLLFGR